MTKALDRSDASIAGPTLNQQPKALARCSSRRVPGNQCSIGVDDTLYRMANTTFDRMLRDPASHRFPVFAGQRVRMADVVVELVGREPACVVRATFAVLTFDDEARLDASKFGKQQFALAETALAPVFAVSDSNETVVDATHRFVAQGGAWAPSKPLARAIDDAALGRRKCPRLGSV